MEFDDRHVEWLRAMLENRDEEMRRLAANLAETDDLGPLVPLLHYAFVLAVRNAFGETFTRSMVIEVVADLRVRLSDTPVSVNAVAAESEIRRALGDPEMPPLYPDADARRVAQTALLGYLVHDFGLGGSQVNDLVHQASQAVAECL